MAYQIRVNCTCGKVLKIPEQYAGKKGRCPNCGKKISVPGIAEIGQKIADRKEEPEPEVRHCPTCGAYLNPGDEVCVSCHTNLKTGEWDSEGRRGSVPSPSKGRYLAVAAVCALLIIGGIFILSQLEPKKPLEIARERGTSPPARTEPPRSPVLPAVQPQANQNVREDAARQDYDKILQKTEGEEYAIKRWVAFREFSARYEGTECLKRLNEQVNPLEKAVQTARAEKDRLRRLFEEQKYTEVLRQGTDWLGKLVRQTYSEETDLQAELVEYVKVCQDAAINYREPVAAEQIVAVNRDEEELRDIQQRYEMYAQDEKGQWRTLESYYRQKAKAWEFSSLVKQIEPLELKARRLQDTYKDDPILQKIIEIYAEAQTLQRFWQCVENAVRALEKSDKAVNLLLKQGDQGMATGKIVKYEDGTIHLTTEKNESRTIKLRDLSARALVMLVARNQERSPQFCAAAACFYYVNNDPFECRTYCDRALDKGIAEEEVAKYRQWALGEIAELERVQAQSEASKQQEESEKAQAKAEAELAQIRKKAWDIIYKKLLPEYRRDNTKMIFEHLETLKNLVPRDELIKINDELKSREGQSLYDIADEAFKYCTLCKNTGKVKCAPCKGTGIIEYTKTLIETETTTKKYCKACGASGEIYCQRCYEKRHNRRYCMIVDFYDEID